MENKYEFKEFLDLKHRYFILVPKDEGALDELYEGQFYDDDNNCVKEHYLHMEFDEKAFLLLEEYLFNFIDAKCDLIITMYEEEWAEPEKLGDILMLTDSMIGNCDNERFIELANRFRKLVIAAQSLNMPVVFYF